MRSAVVISIVLAVACRVAAEGEGAPPAPPAKADHSDQAFYDRYAVLVERNIFSKNRPHVYRRPGAAAAAPEARREPPPPVERSFVLTGIVKELEKPSAFVEDVRSGRTSKLKCGDSIAQGKLTEVGLDHVLYEADGRKTRVELGQDLSGGASRLAVRVAPPASSTPGTGAAPGAEKPASTSPSSATTPPADGKPADAGSGVDDVAERLRKRRLEEMKK
jgi:hypothetical protein